MARRAIHPTVVLHAGELGRAATSRLRPPTQAEPSAASAIALLELPAAPTAAGESEDLSATGEHSLQRAIDGLLSLSAQLAADGDGASSATPQLHTFVVADLAEPAAPLAVRAGIDRLLRLVRNRYAPIFRDYLDDAQARFSCNPVLLLPAAGEQWPEGARGLLDHLEALHREEDAPPAISNIFVVGRCSGRYLLQQADLARMIETFLEVLIYGGLSRSPSLSRLLRRGRDPYATFACATIGFDEMAARRYCALDSAMAIMRWLGQTSARRAEVAERAPEVADLFDIDRYRELVPLEQGDRTLEQVIESQCPDFAAAFRDVGLLEAPERILGYYDRAWQRENRDRLEAARRELELFRIEEVIDEVEVNGAALATQERARVDRYIDAKLSDPAEGSLGDAAVAVGHLRKRLSAERDALARRAAAPLRRSADLDRFDRAYERLRGVAASKPLPVRLLFWSVIGWGVATATTALLLRHLAALLGLGSDSLIRTALLPPWSWATAAAGWAALLAVMLLWRLHRSTTEIRHLVGHRDRRGELLEILEQLSRGSDGSLAAYYGSRFRRACDIWIYRTLLSVLKHVDDRLARLSELTRTLDEQQRAARALQRELGLDSASTLDAHAAAAPSQDRGSARPEALLRRHLIDPRRVLELAGQRRQGADLAALAMAFCRDERPFADWTTTLPFADLADVVGACERFHQPIGERSVLLQPELQQQARERLRRFFAELGPRLDLQLDFSGQLFRDADDVDRSLAQVVIAGSEAADVVAEQLQAAGADQWELVASDDRPANRICLLKLVTGIAGRAIRWHAGRARDDEAPGAAR